MIFIWNKLFGDINWIKYLFYKYLLKLDIRFSVWVEIWIRLGVFSFMNLRIK